MFNVHTFRVVGTFYDFYFFLWFTICWSLVLSILQLFYDREICMCPNIHKHQKQSHVCLLSNCIWKYWWSSMIHYSTTRNLLPEAMLFNVCCYPTLNWSTSNHWSFLNLRLMGMLLDLQASIHWLNCIRQEKNYDVTLK